MNNLRILIDTAVVTAVTFVLSLLMISGLSEVLSLDSSEQKGSEMEDIYSRVAANRPVRKLNPDIVIVGIDGCSRMDIAALIDALAWCEPAAIGIDVFFEYPTGEDDELVSAISACERIVLPVAVDYNPAGESFSISRGSFFYSRIDSIAAGVVNFPAMEAGAIREIRPFYGNMDSFSAALCKMASPKDYDRLQSRGNILETINFTASEFQQYDASDIIDTEGIPRAEAADLLEGKIVLIGALDDFADRHITPVDARMPGVMIHAKALDTMMSGGYIRESAKAVNILLAVLCCFLFSFVNLKSKYSEKWNNIESLGIRFLQMLLIYVFLTIGCRAFIRHGIFFDFSMAVVMMCNSAIFADIWLGVKELTSKLPGAGTKIRDFWRGRKK